MDTTEEKKVGIPESITIKGVTYLVKDTPELQIFAQEIAKVEKSKLYSQFDNLKTQLTNLSKVKVISDGQTFDTESIVEKLKGTFITKEDLQTMLPNVLKEVVQPVLLATEQTRQDDLNQYREKLIQDNLSTCIPDLVKGDTKEALNAALQESIRIRSTYPMSGSEQTGKVKDPLIEKQREELAAAYPNTPTPRSSDTPVPPATPRRESPEVTGRSGVKAMTMRDFEQNRDRLQAELQSMYGN